MLCKVVANYGLYSTLHITLYLALIAAIILFRI